MAFEKANLTALIRVNASKAVSTLNKARASFNSFASAAKQASKTLRGNVSSSANAASSALGRLNGKLGSSTGGLKGFTRGARKLEGGIRTLGTSLSSAGRGFLTLSAATAPALLGIGLAAKRTADFSDEMGVLSSVTNASDEDMRSMSRTALRIGRNTLQGSAEAVRGLTELARAGFTPAELAAEGLNVALFDQANNLKDMGLSARIAVQAARSMRFDDLGEGLAKLTMTANSSATNVKELSQALKFAVPDAKSLGVSNDDLLISLGLMANQGLRAGIAGRNLAAMFRNILQPSKKARDRFGDFTRQLVKVNKQGKKTFVSIPKLIEIMDKKLSRFDPVEQGRAIQDAFGVRGARAFRAIGDAINEANGDLEKLQKAIGNVDSETLWKIALRRTNTFTGQLKLLGTGIESIAVDLFEGGLGGILGPMRGLNEAVRDIGFAIESMTGGITVGGFQELFEARDRFEKLNPVVKGISEGLVDLQNHFSRMGQIIKESLLGRLLGLNESSRDSARNLTVLIGKLILGAAMVSVVAGALGIMLVALGSIATAFAGFVGIIGFAGAALLALKLTALAVGTTMAGVFWPVTAVVAALVLGAFALKQALNKMGLSVFSIFSLAGKVVENFFQGFMEFAGPGIGVLMSAWDDLTSQVADFLGTLSGGENVLQVVGRMAGQFIGGFVTGLSLVMAVVVKVFQFFTWGFGIITQGWNDLFSLITIAGTKAWKILKRNFKAIFYDGVLSLLDSLADIIPTGFKSIFNMIRNAVGLKAEKAKRERTRLFRADKSGGVLDQFIAKKNQEEANRKARIAESKGPVQSDPEKGFFDTLGDLFDVRKSALKPEFVIDFNMKSKTKNENKTEVDRRTVATAVSENEQELRDRIGGAALPWQQTIVRDFGVISIGMERIS